MEYTAWDGSQYQGSPPDGWYQASDGRWWAPGTGPGPAPTVDTQPASSVAVASVAQPPAVLQPTAPATIDSRRPEVPAFYFDGGAATYVGTAILAALVTIFTLGIAFPFAYTLRLRWKAKHTYIEGRRLMFTGTGMGLFGNWIKWLLLILITLGIYTFWVTPRLTKWAVEKQAFDPRP